MFGAGAGFADIVQRQGSPFPGNGRNVISCERQCGIASAALRAERGPRPFIFLPNTPTQPRGRAMPPGCQTDR
ncbi:hypothetical protein Ga0080574_TMP4640 [Salipiger abyssi]|uniref:Uncharacterized protein n=1 Tax=Salipiger abyssi TaxID=1250539 RepID=A0A1P8UZZ1_9RHOB|nr:hypothetical protein Ga0080574_TMP4640 [Salipiger abyssi]